MSLVVGQKSRITRHFPHKTIRNNWIPAESSGIINAVLLNFGETRGDTETQRTRSHGTMASRFKDRPTRVVSTHTAANDTRRGPPVENYRSKTKTERAGATKTDNRSRRRPGGRRRPVDNFNLCRKRGSSSLWVESKFEFDIRKNDGKNEQGEASVFIASHLDDASRRRCDAARRN